LARSKGSINNAREELNLSVKSGGKKGRNSIRTDGQKKERKDLSRSVVAGKEKEV